MSVAYGEQQRHSSAFGDTRFGAAAPVANSSQRDLERQYHVVLQDSLGHPALGFKDGTWFRLTVSGPQPLQLRGAIRHCPHAAGSIVQIACWWMRENPLQPRSLDLATELALTVGELVRACPADYLGSSSGDLMPLPMTLAPATPAMPPVQALPPAALPAAPPQPAFAAQPPQSAFAAPMAAPMVAAAPTGSWFDPDTTGTGGFPAIPPAPVMGARSAAAQTTAMPVYQPAPSANAYPNAPQAYSAPTSTQAALPAAASYQPAPAQLPQSPNPALAPRPAAPRGYGEQAADWDRSVAPRRPAPPQPGQQPPPRQQQPGPRPAPAGGTGTGQHPRPRPQPPRPEFRDERRDSFERRLGPNDQPESRRSSDRIERPERIDRLDRSSDRLDRSSDRLDRSSDRLDRSSDRLDRSSDRISGTGAGTGNGVPPRRPNPQQQQPQQQPPQRGTMGRRPATRPGRQSDW